MRSDNLKRHIESCKEKPKSGVCTYGNFQKSYSTPEDEDDESVLSFGTMNNVINKGDTYPSSMGIIPYNAVPPSKERAGDVESMIRKPAEPTKKRRVTEDYQTSAAAKKSRQEDDRRPDIIDCMGYITPIKGDGIGYINGDVHNTRDGYDEGDSDMDGEEEVVVKTVSDEDAHDASESIDTNEESNSVESMENAKIQDSIDADDISKVLPEFIDHMIKKPRKRIRELLHSLKKNGIDDGEYVDKLEKLIDEFLRGGKKVTKDIENALRALKTTSTTVEISNILNHIEDMNIRFTDILRRLSYALEEEGDQIINVLRTLKQEHTISRSAFEKLHSEDEVSDLTIPYIIEVLKAHPDREDEEVTTTNGRGGVVFLPGTDVGLLQKLCLLTAEYDAGNKTTRNEIVAILDRLYDRKGITEKDYNECNNWLDAEEGDHDKKGHVQKICNKLSDLGAKYHAGDHDTSTAQNIWECTEALVNAGAVTNRQCQEVRCKLINDCEHVLH